MLIVPETIVEVPLLRHERALISALPATGTIHLQNVFHNRGREICFVLLISRDYRNRRLF